MDYTNQKQQVQSSQKDQQSSPSCVPLTPNLNSSAAKRMSNVPLLRPESFIEEDSEEDDDGLYYIGNLPSGAQSNAANTPKTQSPLIFTNNNSPNIDDQTSFQSFSSLNYNQPVNSNSSQAFNFQPRASSPPPRSSNGNGTNDIQDMVALTLYLVHYQQHQHNLRETQIKQTRISQIQIQVQIP
ncbi:unnamed protein product [[Candida] boidinii]|uniref:Unnamed protein product n=1 Tax=Candida boidinii TaxID=5477 RepID=A0ACB5TTE8_CANBO|nr:unnamed protein product [[Candida] boidinii]